MTRKPAPAPPPTRSRVLSAQLLYPNRRGKGPLLSVTSPAAPAVAALLRPSLRPASNRAAVRGRDCGPCSEPAAPHCALLAGTPIDPQPNSLSSAATPRRRD